MQISSKNIPTGTPRTLFDQTSAVGGPAKLTDTSGAQGGAEEPEKKKMGKESDIRLLLKRENGEHVATDASQTLKPFRGAPRGRGQGGTRPPFFLNSSGPRPPHALPFLWPVRVMQLRSSRGRDSPAGDGSTGPAQAPSSDAGFLLASRTAAQFLTS